MATTYGELTVVEVKEKTYVCSCSCGAVIERPKKYLHCGDTKSCGCLRRKVTAAKNTANATHNESKSYMYTTWSAIIGRCTNLRNKDYHKYGGRGITVSTAWLESYEQFRGDMGERPSTKHSVDRKDNDKGYDKDNCRWATYTEQAQNRRNNINLEHNGEVYCIAEWARRTGLTEDALYRRITKYGWSVEKALTIRKRGKHEINS